jgi:hypothetical protein
MASVWLLLEKENGSGSGSARRLLEQLALKVPRKSYRSPRIFSVMEGGDAVATERSRTRALAVKEVRIPVVRIAR